MSYDENIRLLNARVLQVINELDSINDGYASWDDWDKTKIIDAAVNALKEGFIKEILEATNQ